MENIYEEGYMNWTCHGEELWSHEPSNVEGTSTYVDMVVDAAGPTFNVHEDLVYAEDVPNKGVERFYQLLKDADEPLWDDMVRGARSGSSSGRSSRGRGLLAASSSGEFTPPPPRVPATGSSSVPPPVAACSGQSTPSPPIVAGPSVSVPPAFLAGASTVPEAEDATRRGLD
ncbi:hypothetical protein Taro_050807 [Colocasia esculenta]|uniref:Uncharacterized protein n=1 Tax=Colocasia esculenta TaxID=4460 RepID=A0A843XF90_COLES|nr:hypothetical protein [Colocasia esculenta]